MSLVAVGILAGCESEGYYGAGYGYDEPYVYGPGYYDYYGPAYYGGVWGPDVYVFGDHDHERFEHHFEHRGFESRREGGGFRGGGFHGGFHGGGGFRGGGGFHGGAVGHGGGGRGR